MFPNGAYYTSADNTRDHRTGAGEWPPAYQAPYVHGSQPQHQPAQGRFYSGNPSATAQHDFQRQQQQAADPWRAQHTFAPNAQAPWPSTGAYHSAGQANVCRPPPVYL
jgi:hypothetical protein